MVSEQSTESWFSWPVWIVIGFVTLIHAVWWMTGDQIVAGGGFGDGDSYLRLLRVERLIETADWFDVSIPDANAPFGTTLHWTRLFDLILLALAAPAMPLVGVAKALFWAGVIVSPVIHILSAISLAWALIPVLGRTGACIAGALSASQAGLLAFSLVGRADHHMVFILLAVLGMGCLLRALLSPEGGIWAARRTGLLLALGIWEGPENLVLLTLYLGVLGLPWLMGEQNRERQNFGAAQGLFAGLLIALIIERGVSGILNVEYDRISIVHLTFSLLLVGFWGSVVYGVHRHCAKLGKIWRVAVALIGLTVLSGVMVILFPKVLGNPLNDADPAIQPIYARISEYRSTRQLDRFLIYFGSILFVGPWLIWKLKSTWKQNLFWAWVLLAAGTALYTLFGMNWLRWSMYGALFLSIVLSDLIMATDRWVNRMFAFPRRVVVKVLVIVGIGVGPMFLGAVLLDAGKTVAERVAATTRACPIRELSAFLNAAPWSSRSRIIDASANFGAEIMYRTDMQVLATVHHRNVSGILDGFRILNLDDDTRIKSLVRKRQVDLILLCPGSGDDSYFLMEDKSTSLYRRLEREEYPSWITPVKLPRGLAEKFRLFEIHHPL